MIISSSSNNAQPIPVSESVVSEAAEITSSTNTNTNPHHATNHSQLAAPTSLTTTVSHPFKLESQPKTTNKYPLVQPNVILSKPQLNTTTSTNRLSNIKLNTNNKNIDTINTTTTTTTAGYPYQFPFHPQLMQNNGNYIVNNSGSTGISGNRMMSNMRPMGILPLHGSHVRSMDMPVQGISLFLNKINF